MYRRYEDELGVIHEFAPMNPVLKKATEIYGRDSQSLMAIEEMSELTKALSKFKRGEDDVDPIAEEIADVEIMLEQLKELYDCRDAVERWKDYKIKRLEARLEDSEKEKESK